MKTVSYLMLLFGCILLNYRSQGQGLSCNWLHTGSSPGMQSSKGQDITTDIDGNFLVAGEFGGTVDIDPSDSISPLESDITSAYLAKYSPDQDLIWAFVIGGPSSARINKVRALYDGKILVSGHFTNTCDFDPGDNEFVLESLGWSDAFMAVYSTDGLFINAICVGGALGDEWCFDSNMDSQGNFYLIGYFYSSADLDPSLNEYIVYEYSGTSLDMFIVKLSSTLEFIWGGIVGGSGSGFEIPAGICINANNDIVIGGLAEGNPDFDLTDDVQNAEIQIDGNSQMNCFLAKYTSDGSLIDAKIFGGVGNDYITTMSSNESGYLIAGVYSGSGDFDPGSETLDFETFGDYDAFLIQLDESLNVIWAYNIGSSEYEEFRDVAIDEQGNIAVAGSFEKTIDFDNSTDEYLLSVPETVEGLYPDAVVVLFSFDGQFREAQNFGGWYYDQAFGVAINESNILLSGCFTHSASLGNCYAAVVGETFQEEAYVLCLHSDYLLVENDEGQNFEVYPNPADQFINIAFNKHQSLKDAEIKLYDLPGRLIKQTTLQHHQATYMFDCSSLENGTYLLSIETERFVSTKKIVLTH